MLFRVEALDCLKRSMICPRVFLLTITMIFMIGILIAPIFCPFTSTHARSRADDSRLTVVSAASYSERAIAPNSIVTAFGANLATARATATDTDPNTPGVQLPTTLVGTTVRVKGVAAPLLFVSPEQINFIIPTDTAPSTSDQDFVSVEVASGNGEISSGKVLITTVAPAIFTFDGSGRGMPAAYLVRVKNGDNKLESLVEVDRATGALAYKAIDLGAEDERVFLVLFLSGIHAASDPNKDGNRNETIRVTLNGYEVMPSYAGPQPDFPGLDQINVELPRSFLGNQRLAVRVFAGGQPITSTPANGPEPTGIISNTTEVPLLVPAAAQAKWRQSGLEGQDVHVLAASEDTALAGATTGIFRSQNDGADWIESPYSLPTTSSARRALSLIKVSDQLFIAGTDGGGIWFSSLDALAWTHDLPDLPVRRERVFSLAVNQRRVFAGTAGAGVFRQFRPPSGNAQLWQSGGLNGQSIKAMATCEDRVFAATETSGLMVTTNDGDNWRKVEGGLPADVQILTLVVNGRTIYAGTTAGLWRSEDSGTIWKAVQLPVSAAVNAVLPDGTNIFVGTSGSGVLVSIDNGVTWKPFSEGLANRNVLSLINFGGRLFAGTKGGGVYVTQLVADSNLPPTADSQTVSLDEDTTLPIKLTGGDPNDEPISFRIINFPKYGQLIGNAPNLRYQPVPNYFGPDSFIFVTNDGKATSRTATVTINVRPVEDPLQLSISGDDSAIIGGLVILNISGFDYDGDDSIKVTVKSLPQGAIFDQPGSPSRAIAKWVPTSAGTYTFSFIATGSTGKSLSKDVKVTVRPPQFTENWSQIPLFLDKQVVRIEVDGTTIYLILAGIGSDRTSVLLRSNDNGMSWTNISNGLPISNSSHNLVIDDGILYVSGSSGIFRSTNGGATWVNLSSGKGLPDGTFLFVAARGDKLLASNNQRLFVSIDAANSWTEVTNNLPIKPSGYPSLPGGAIHTTAISGDAFLVSLSSGTVSNGPIVFRSTDNGASWRSAINGLNGAVSINQYINDGDRLYGLTALFLHLSSDHGANWELLNPLFSPSRPSISPNLAADVKDGLLMILYREGEIQLSRDNGQNWTNLGFFPGEEINAVAIGSSSFFAITSSGKLYLRPRK